MADEAIRLTVELTFLCEFANPNAVFEWVPALFGNPADSAEGAGSRRFSDFAKICHRDRSLACPDALTGVCAQICAEVCAAVVCDAPVSLPGRAAGRPVLVADIRAATPRSSRPTSWLPRLGLARRRWHRRLSRPSRRSAVRPSKWYSKLWHRRRRRSSRRRVARAIRQPSRLPRRPRSRCSRRSRLPGLSVATPIPQAAGLGRSASKTSGLPHADVSPDVLQIRTIAWLGDPGHEGQARETHLEWGTGLAS